MTELERQLYNALRDAEDRLRILRERLTDERDDRSAYFAGFIEKQIRATLDLAQRKD